MPPAGTTEDFCPPHSMARICLFDDGSDGRVKTWPTRTGVEFGASLKEHGLTAGTAKCTIGIDVEQGASKCRLGSGLAEDRILIRRELTTPFFIRLFH